MTLGVPPESLAVTIGVHCVLEDGLSYPREGDTQPHPPGVLPFLRRAAILHFLPRVRKEI